ncbi:MAG: Acetyltransferase family protein [Clostridia bacterium]|jgi:RimJ/RimL family protein N-acetyltransferase|nr:Acetyltransferase family protein [Clostridia bacterium]
MLTINLNNENLFFKDIRKDNLQEVLKLYNQNEINMYATGIDGPMSYEDINQKYLEVLVNSHEFFAGIFTCNLGNIENKMIGVIKGRIDYDNNEEAWISSLLIDSSYQKIGIGTKAVGAILKMLNNTYDIKSVMIGTLSGNNIGREFWRKIGFNYIRTIQQYIKLNNKTEDFIIMKKDLKYNL